MDESCITYLLFIINKRNNAHAYTIYIHVHIQMNQKKTRTTIINCIVYSNENLIKNWHVFQITEVYHQLKLPLFS